MTTFEEIKHGNHVCSLYFSDDECFRLANAFFRPSIHQNDKCWLLADSSMRRELVANLANSGIKNIPGRPPRVEVADISSDESPKSFLETWRERVRSAISQGFSGIRLLAVFGKHFPSRQRTAPNLSECESAFSALVLESPTAVCCAYGVEAVDPEIMLAMLLRHPFVKTGDWVCTNPQFVPFPDSGMSLDDQARERIEICLRHALQDEMTQHQLEKSLAELERNKIQIAKLRLLLEKAVSANHQIALPLEHITLSLGFLKLRLQSEDPGVKLHIEAIEAAVDHMQSCMRHLLSAGVYSPAFGSKHAEEFLPDHSSQKKAA